MGGKGLDLTGTACEIEQSHVLEISQCHPSNQTPSGEV